MDAGDIFNRGDSIPRTIVLTYEDTGLPIDLDDLDEIEFEIIHSTTNRTLGTYTLTGGDITKQDAANGISWFAVGQTVSATAKRGDWLILVTTDEADVNYENSTHIRKGMGFCFKLN